MSTRKYTQHSVETKMNTVRRVLSDGIPVAIAAKEVGVHRDTVYNWIKAYKNDGKEGLVSSSSVRQSLSTKTMKENLELKKKLKEKEMEIEILKKFQAFLKENE